MWPFQPPQGGPQLPTVFQPPQPVQPFEQPQHYAQFAGAPAQPQEISQVPPWRQHTQQLQAQQQVQQQMQYVTHPWPEPSLPQFPQQQQLGPLGQPQQFTFTTRPLQAPLQDTGPLYQQQPVLAVQPPVQQQMVMGSVPVLPGIMDAAAAARALVDQQHSRVQSEPLSKKKVKKGAAREAATSAAKSAIAAAAQRTGGRVSGTKRPQPEPSGSLAAAADAGMEQQVLKRLKTEPRQLDNFKEEYLSLLDLCLRKTRLRRMNSSSSSSGSGRGASSMQGLLTLPQLRTLVNSAAQSDGLRPLDLSQLMELLEGYLLALDVPTARQQKRNQQRATEQTALAMQRAARVVHASVAADETSNSKQQQPQSKQPAGAASNSKAMAAATMASAQQQQQQQQQPEKLQQLSPRQKRHMRFADNGSVTFSPGLQGRQGMQLRNKPTAAGNIKQQQDQQQAMEQQQQQQAVTEQLQPQHIRFMSDDSDVDDDDDLDDDGGNDCDIIVSGGPEQVQKAAAHAAEGALSARQQQQQRRRQEEAEPDQDQRLQQLPPKRRRQNTFADDGSAVFSPGTLKHATAASMMTQPAAAAVQQSMQQLLPQHTKFVDGGEVRSVVANSNIPAVGQAAQSKAAAPPPPPQAAAAAAAQEMSIATTGADTTVHRGKEAAAAQGGSTADAAGCAAAVNTAEVDAAVIDGSITLPLVWDAEALDQLISSCVNNRGVCTVMDVRDQLLVSHGMTVSLLAPAGGLLMAADGLAACPAVRKHFNISQQLNHIPPVTSRHVVQAATLVLLSHWQQQAQQQHVHTPPTLLTPVSLEHHQLLRELFLGQTSAADQQCLQSCLRLCDLPTLAELTAQQLKPALAAAESAVLQQLTSRMSGEQQTVAAQGQQVQHALAVQVDTIREQQRRQQQQLPSGLTDVCSVLGLDSSSYQALLEEVALLAETCLRNAGQWSEWSCMRTFSNSLTELLESTAAGGQVRPAGPSCPSPQAAVQLMQHVLYYAVNGRCAELYTTRPPPPPAPAPTAAAAVSAHQAATEPHEAAATDPVSQLANILGQLHGSFLALFPVGRQYSPAELEQLKATLAQKVAIAHLRQLQQQSSQAETIESCDGELPPELATAAASDVGKVMMLVQRLLQTPANPTPPPATAESSSLYTGSSCSSSLEDDGSNDVGSHDDDSNRKLLSEQPAVVKPAASKRQKQQLAQQRRTISLSQLTDAFKGLADGFSIAALARLEQQLQEKFAVESFRELGIGADTLLQLLQQQPQLLAVMTGQADALPCDVGAKVELQEVLLLTRQAKACCTGMPDDQLAAAVTRCLCATFGVQHVEHLGHGSVNKLLGITSTAAAIEGPAGGRGISSSSVWSVYALAASQLAETSQTAGSPHIPAVEGSFADSPPGGVLVRGVDKDAAIHCLVSAPVMADLYSWSRWPQVFAASLGDAGQFIAAEGPAAGLMALSVPQTAAAATAGCAFGPGLLLKLDPAATKGQLQAAAAKGQAVQLVGTSLSLLAKSGGLALAPLSLMAQEVEAGLKGRMAQQGSTAAAAAGSTVSLPIPASASAAAAFTLQCLALTPEPLTAHLGQRLLLQPLYNLVGSAAAAHDLLLDVANAAALEAAAFHVCSDSVCTGGGSSGARAAAYSPELAVLHRLGCVLGVLSWQQDWLGRCCQSDQSHIAAADRAPDQEPSDTGVPTVVGNPIGAGLASDSVLTHDTELQHLLQKIQPPQQLQSLTASATTSAALSAPAAALTPCTTFPPQQQLIEQIRQEDFGVGVELLGAAGELVARQRARIGRALTRLSKELYSSNTHFVLELVQNADDNSYAAGTLPALEFLLLPGAVAALNNEVGFTEPDVRALCDVGASTKVARQGSSGGYIGYKGIGFKSVFKVTDAPQLHSAGYHIKFDLQHDPAQGYILPSWISPQERQEAGSAAASSRLGLRFDSITSIYMPLKQPTVLQRQQQQLHASSLRQRFQDIKPALLLFLEKLSCICVTDVCQPSCSTVIFKRQLSKQVVELRHGATAQHAEHWLVVRSSLNLPSSWHARHQDSSADITITSSSTTASQLALAFALNNLQQPQQQPVFAFLPLRSYGLKFILQADWQVPSSREAVDSDSPWNQALRDEVPSLLYSAMQAFIELAGDVGGGADSGAEASSSGGQLELPRSLRQQQGLGMLPKLSREAWLDCWLRCLPLEGQVQGFFGALPISVATYLRSQPCIPTESGDLVLPSEALVCNNSTVRQLISPQQLQQLLGKQFVHAEVTALHTSAELRVLLGVGEFSPLQVVQLIEQMVVAGSLQQQGVQWVQRVLLCLFGMLQAGSSSAAAAAGGGGGVMGGWCEQAGQLGRARVLQKLRRLQILPLQDGSFAALEGAKATAAAGQAGRPAAESCAHLPQPYRSTASCSIPVFFPLQGISGTTAAADAAETGEQQSISNPVPGKTPAAAGADAGGVAADSSLLQLLSSAGICVEWLSQLQLLSSELFSGLSSDELEQLHTGLLMLGVCHAQPIDVLQLSLLPAMTSTAALHWGLDRLVAYLAFPLLAGLVQSTAGPTAAKPAAAHTVLVAATPAPAAGGVAVSTVSKTAAGMTGRWTVGGAEGHQGLRRQQVQHSWLLAALRECAVVHTVQGPVRLSATEATGSSRGPPAHRTGPAVTQQYRSSSVYLPPCWTSHGTDWQQQFPQLHWQVISPLYQQLHPGLDQEWSALFVQLGAKSLPPTFPRTISIRKLQQQQRQLQEQQSRLLDRVQQLQAVGSCVQQQSAAGPTPGAPARAAATDLRASQSAVSLDTSADCGAVDMDTSCGEEVFQPLHQQQEQEGQSHEKFSEAFQLVTLADAAAGAYEALAAAAAAVTELEAASAATDALQVMPADKASTDELDEAADDDLMQDWVCPDLQALLTVLAESATGVTELHDVMTRLLKLLDDHWDAYAPHTWASAIADAGCRAAEPVHGADTTHMKDKCRQQVQPGTPVPLVWQAMAAQPASQRPWQEALEASAEAVTPDRQEVGPEQALTSFGQVLRHALLPCCHKGGQASSSSDRQQQPCLLPGQQLLLPTGDMLAVFTCFRLPWLAVPVQHQQLLDVLQVRSQLSVQLVLNVLTCQAKALPVGQAPSCEEQLVQQQQQVHTLSSDCQLMALPYKYLQQQLDAAEQQTAADPVPVAGSRRDSWQQPRAPNSTQQPYCNTMTLHQQYQHLQQLVSSAFQQHPLVWLPDTLDDAPGSAACPLGTRPPGLSVPPGLQEHKVCMGRWYRLDELCLKDPSGVLEHLACKQKMTMGIGGDTQSDKAAAAATATAAAACCIPRPVLLHYAWLHKLFSKHIASAAAVPGEHASSLSAASFQDAAVRIAAEPSLEQYISALQLLAAGRELVHSLKPTTDQAVWTQVLDMLAVLAQRQGDGQLSISQLNSLQQSLQRCCWLWCYNQQRWVGLQQEPYVSDDVKLSTVMAQVSGVCLLQLAAPDAGRPSSGAAAQQQMTQLLSVLGAPPLSQSVTSELDYEEMSDWHEMAQTIADALLLAQRWCWYNRTQQQYETIAERLLPKLDFLTVVAVRNLAISYNVVVEGGDTAVSSPVPAAVIQHDMQLLVAPDQPGLYLEMADTLARLVLGNASDMGNLTDLLLLTLHELSTGNDAEVLMQSRNIQPLPTDTACTLASHQQLDHAVAAAPPDTHNSQQVIRSWHLYVPAASALFNETDDAADDAPQEADDVEAADMMHFRGDGLVAGPGSDDDPVGADAELMWAQASDDDDSDYDDKEEELKQLDTEQEEQQELEGIVTNTAGADVVLQPQARDSTSLITASTAAAAAAVRATNGSSSAAAVAAANESLQRQGLCEPVIVPVRQIPFVGTGKLPMVLSIHAAAQVAVARYLAYAAPISNTATAGDTGAHEESAAVHCSAVRAQAATDSTGKDSAAADPGAARVAAASPTPLGGDEAQTPQADAAAPLQPVANSRLPATGGNMLSCGPQHLVEAAQAAFFKLLDGKTVTQEDADRVLPAAGATAAALSQAAGMSYGCREHVAFISRLLAGFIPGRLGKSKQWKSRQYRTADLNAAAQALISSSIQVVNVTGLQPLVLWEAASDIQSYQRKATGRWGEQLVAIYLTVKLANCAEVVWVNDRQETGLPYDIKITHSDGRVEFVEVKTTAQHELQQFYISLKELETAAKYGKAFSIVRVFGCPVYSLRPQQGQIQVALVPGMLRHTPIQQQQQLAAHHGRLNKQCRSGVSTDPMAGRYFTKLLFLQDPVQLLRRQLVKLLMEV